MRRMGFWGWLALVLTVIGAINWGLVGLFGFNLVEAIFGAGTLLTSIVYIIVGLAGIGLLVGALAMASASERRNTPVARRSEQLAMGGGRPQGTATRINPVQLQKYLKGVDYPASKTDLLEQAERNGADRNVMETLSALPRDNFDSPNDVSEAIGEM